MKRENKILVKEFIVHDEVYVGNKRAALNLNVYRNMHFQTLNKAKKIFKETLYKNYPDLSTINASSMEVGYLIIPCDERMFDTMNIISIVDKFFVDAVKESGAIPDDDYKRVTYGKIDVLPYIKPAEKQPNQKTDKKRKIVINCVFFY